MADDVKSSTRRYARAVGPFHGHYLGSQKSPVFVFNLNIGGAFVHFATQQPASLTTRFVLAIDLPEDGTISVLSQKVYRDPSGMGVRFIDLEDADAKRVARAVERMRAQQANLTPIVKLPRSSIVFTFDRKSEVVQIEGRHTTEGFEIVRRFADGTNAHETFSVESEFRSRLDELRSELQRGGWQTAGPTLRTDG